MTVRGRNTGFTLVEVLIGIAVLAMMMSLLTSALFTMTRSARAGEKQLEALDSAQLVYAFLRRQLQSAFPLTERDDGEELVLFEGSPERLRFVGQLPRAAGLGLQFIDLRVERNALVMRFRAAWPDAPLSAEAVEWERRVLLPDVRRARWRYFGAANDLPAKWAEDWSGRDRLPELVQLELEHGDESFTTLAAEVRVRTAVAQAALFREPIRGAP